MIVASQGRDLQVAAGFSIDWPAAWPYASGPDSSMVGGSLTGRVSLERALGLPALLGVLLRIGQGAGMVPLKVYRGQAPSREVAADSWQYELLHDRPNSEGPPFAFYGDLAFSLAGAGYACARKYSSRGRVVELIPLDPTKVTPRRDAGRLVFDDRTESSTPVVRDRSEILYIRGIAMPGEPVGLSPIAAARLGILNGLRRQLFEHAYFENNAQAGVILSFPERMTEKQAKGWVDLWNADHQGVENWHTASAIGGGATVTTLPISMEDAQFVEANRMTAEQMGGIYAMPKSFLNVGDNSPTADDWRFFVTFGLGWILTAIAQSITADRDLFPLDPRPERRMLAEHVVDALLRPDTKTRYEAYKAARQAGWLTANEVRALENYPPVDGGDELQATPVGGAPNQQETAVQALAWLADNATAEQLPIIERALERAGMAGSR